MPSGTTNSHDTNLGASFVEAQMALRNKSVVSMTFCLFLAMSSPLSTLDGSNSKVFASVGLLTIVSIALCKVVFMYSEP